MNLKQLFAFMFLMCGVLSANAQSEDKAMDVANGDSVILYYDGDNGSNMIEICTNLI